MSIELAIFFGFLASLVVLAICITLWQRKPKHTPHLVPRTGLGPRSALDGTTLPPLKNQITNLRWRINE